jgi:SMI1 / KNR4 family (SUKH-1)
VGFGVHLQRLSYESDGPDSPAEVDRLERLIGVPLPSDYRQFLLTCGGGSLDASSPCEGLTPFGDTCSVTQIHSATEVIDLLDSAVTPRNFICVSFGHAGQTGCLSIAGLDHGQVFALDTQMRFYWDAETLGRMPHLAPSIQEFFRLRDADKRPERPCGYDNCYAMAESFADFVARLRPAL